MPPLSPKEADALRHAITKRPDPLVNHARIVRAALSDERTPWTEGERDHVLATVPDERLEAAMTVAEDP
jgi:hypothetical protein